MAFLSQILRIIVIDLVLSGDNAVVIGMAAHRLPIKQRKQAIVIGGGAAIVLRIGLTLIATLLLQIPGLQFFGGLVLLWIAFKLLKEEEESAEGIKAANTMREAVTTILLADLVMSTDNVIAVAASAAGHYGLLMFGLIFSMAILMFLGNLVATLINKYAWLSYVGAAAIAWTGAHMIFEDPVVLSRAEWLTKTIAYIFAAIITLGLTAFAHWFHRVRGED